jgi:hypothetical protein
MMLASTWLVGSDAVGSKNVHIVRVTGSPEEDAFPLDEPEEAVEVPEVPLPDALPLAPLAALSVELGLELEDPELLEQAANVSAVAAPTASARIERTLRIVSILQTRFAPRLVATPCLVTRCGWYADGCGSHNAHATVRTGSGRVS